MTRSTPLFLAQLAFTLLVAAFLVVPVVLSITAGFTANYFVGLSSGLFFRALGRKFVGFNDDQLVVIVFSQFVSHDRLSSAAL